MKQRLVVGFVIGFILLLTFAVRNCSRAEQQQPAGKIAEQVEPIGRGDFIEDMETHSLWCVGKKPSSDSEILVYGSVGSMAPTVILRDEIKKRPWVYRIIRQTDAAWPKYAKQFTNP
jgi:hypothetical protein